MEALAALEALLENGGPFVYILAIVLTVIPAFITAMTGRRRRLEQRPRPFYAEENKPRCGFSEDEIYDLAHRAASEAIKSERDHHELHVEKLFFGLEQRLLELQRAIVARQD